MKKLFFVFGIFTLLLLFGCNSNNKIESQGNTNVINPEPVGAKIIEIKDLGFSQPELRIKKEDTVTWINQDSVKHTVTSDKGNELNSNFLSKSESYSHTFANFGTFEYHCNAHPSMKARIIVE
ncbi:cupredoxin domain-containing protein [Candidatus Woesearchaeota archaeon]|nr:cupredoxin domain-containing protein [Candidatus Woesearchaeota archaeon]